jgi:hypothetical protein
VTVARKRFMGAAVLAGITVLLLAYAPSPASAAVCEQFQVGTPQWTQCVEDAASGTQPGGGGKSGKQGQPDTDIGGQLPKGPEGEVCSEFPVGSAKWTNCIEGAATGGGLMPWIVIIPLGVMVVGMAILFGWQAMRGDKTFSTSGVGSTSAVWLIFIGLIEIGMAAGFFVAESKADSATSTWKTTGLILGGTGAVLLIAGIVVAVKARGKKKIATTGLVGTGTVVSADPTGVTINDAPVLQFQLDIEGPGLAPYRAKVRATMPFMAFGQITAGTKLPVRIDQEDNSKVLIDWDNWTPTPMVPAQPNPMPGATT